MFFLTKSAVIKKSKFGAKLNNDAIFLPKLHYYNPVAISSTGARTQMRMLNCETTRFYNWNLEYFHSNFKRLANSSNRNTCLYFFVTKVHLQRFKDCISRYDKSMFAAD